MLSSSQNLPVCRGVESGLACITAETQTGYLPYNNENLPVCRDVESGLACIAAETRTGYLPYSSEELIKPTPVFLRL
jgi:hypothetical protein